MLEVQNVDLKRQLQVVEQEASVFRTKAQTLESENDKLLAEVKKVQLQLARNNIKGTSNSINDTKLKSTVESIEKERDELKLKIQKLLDDPLDTLPSRTPKVYTDTKTKLQLKVAMRNPLKYHLKNIPCRK